VRWYWMNEDGCKAGWRRWQQGRRTLGYGGRGYGGAARSTWPSFASLASVRNHTLAGSSTNGLWLAFHLNQISPRLVHCALRYSILIPLSRSPESAGRILFANKFPALSLGDKAARNTSGRSILNQLNVQSNEEEFCDVSFSNHAAVSMLVFESL
jgi:hypothetical protein